MSDGIEIYCDVGGTSIKISSNAHKQINIYATDDYENLNEAIFEFLRQKNASELYLSEVFISAAGPASENSFVITNNDIKLGDVGAPVHIVNDAVASAMAFEAGEPSGAGEWEGAWPQKNDLVGLISIGTGIGVAVREPMGGGRFRYRATEIGHAYAAPVTGDGARLLSVLMEGSNQPFTYEELLGGLGQGLWDSLAHEGRLSDHDKVRRVWLSAVVNTVVAAYPSLDCVVFTGGFFKHLRRDTSLERFIAELSARVRVPGMKTLNFGNYLDNTLPILGLKRLASNKREGMSHTIV